MRNTMNATLLAGLLLTAVGCEPADPPEDVSRSTQPAQQDSAAASSGTAQLSDGSNGDAAISTSADDESREIVIAQAESDYRAMIARCRTIAEDAQASCRQAADAQLEVNRALAEQRPTDEGS